MIGKREMATGKLDESGVSEEQQAALARARQISFDTRCLFLGRRLTAFRGHRVVLACVTGRSSLSELSAHGGTMLAACGERCDKCGRLIRA
jgi:hypothetical protein